MQDMAMILGLPLEGNAVTAIIQTDGWKDMVEGSYQGEASYTIRWGEGQEDVQGKLGLVEAALQPLSCRSRANGGREACLCLVMAPLWWIFLPLWKWKHCIMDDPANP